MVWIRGQEVHLGLVLGQETQSGQNINRRLKVGSKQDAQGVGFSGGKKLTMGRIRVQEVHSGQDKG